MRKTGEGIQTRPFRAIKGVEVRNGTKNSKVMYWVMAELGLWQREAWADNQLHQASFSPGGNGSGM